MKQRILILIFSLIAIMLMLMPNRALASAYYDYTIKSYYVDMIVNENNTFDITETITVNFNKPKHGIFRKIPLTNQVMRLDGSITKNNASVKIIKVSDKYKLSYEKGFRVIKIGDANKTHTGEYTYTIRYVYNIGKDPLKDVDELYFNIIGTEWDTSIDKVYFSIHMPKSFDEEYIGFSSGRLESIDTSNIKFSVSDNIINGHTVRQLNAGEGLTTRILLPDGYFKGENVIVISNLFTIILSIVFVILGYGLWSKYGRDDEVVETIEFYPPKEYNSAEVQFLLDGTSTNQGVISLLVYLADKGYLKIEQDYAPKSGSKDFKVTKLKEYDGDNKIEKIFFDDLFENTSQRHKTCVYGEDLYDKFYTTVNVIKGEINNKKNKKLIFEESANKKAIDVMLMIVMIFILTTIVPTIVYGTFAFSIELIMYTLIGFLTIFQSLFKIKNKIAKIIGTIIGSVIGILPWTILAYFPLTNDKSGMITFIIGYICIGILFVILAIMPKRTKYGTDILGKVKGFKRFLETAEKNQLELLVEQNPEYFYNILPYTYALGISDKWMEQFEIMGMQETPEWYDDYEDDFDISKFNNFLKDTMDTAKSVMISMPEISSTDSGYSSSSRGFSSGGGFSGGGSGGGRRRIMVT